MDWVYNKTYESKEPLSFAQPVLATNNCTIPTSAQWCMRHKMCLRGSDCLWQYRVLSNIVKYGVKCNCKLVTWNCAINPLMVLNMFRQCLKVYIGKEASKHLTLKTLN